MFRQSDILVDKALFCRICEWVRQNKIILHAYDIISEKLDSRQLNGRHTDIAAILNGPLDKNWISRELFYMYSNDHPNSFFKPVSIVENGEEQYECFYTELEVKQ